MFILLYLMLPYVRFDLPAECPKILFHKITSCYFVVLHYLQLLSRYDSYRQPYHNILSTKLQYDISFHKSSTSGLCQTVTRERHAMELNSERSEEVLTQNVRLFTLFLIVPYNYKNCSVFENVLIEFSRETYA
jgi:hypothetical protein